MKIPFLQFDHSTSLIKDECMQVCSNFLDTGHFVLGKMTNDFEKSYAIFNQVSHCVGVSNGLDALQLALKVCEIGVGDEVIVPSNTYIASILSIIHVGATPILVEPNSRTFNLDPTQIEANISSKTQAIMPVHLYGQACEMGEIMTLAKKYNLKVIEDNAQSQGAQCDGKMCGSFGDMNATSFYPSKNLGAFGEAGAVTTDNETLAQMAKTYRNYGSKVRYHNEVIGHNWRIDELQAGFLCVKLKYLSEWQQKRIELAERYKENLKDIVQLQLPHCHPNSTHVYHLFIIIVQRRERLIEYLTSKGIQTLIHYPIPPHRQVALQHFDLAKQDFPIADFLAEHCLSLPLHPGLNFEQIDYISEQIHDFYV